MRAIFLNCWLGNTGKPLFDYIKDEASVTDIFCLVEVTPKLRLELSDILDNFSCVYDKGRKIKQTNVYCGQAIFVRKGIEILRSKKISIYRQSPLDVGFLLFTEVMNKEKKIAVGCVHGKAFPWQKLDTPVRLKQSERIIDFFSDKGRFKIIGGDFNLYPNTRSVNMFEDRGYVNMIKRFNIKETRNRLAWEFYKNAKGFVPQHFADYCFVSPEIKVLNFKVPNAEVSDHEPLMLDFEI